MKVLIQVGLLATLLVLAFARPQEGSKRLVKTSESDPGKWVDEATLLSMKRDGIHFVDITDHTYSFNFAPPTVFGEIGFITLLYLKLVTLFNKFYSQIIDFPSGVQYPTVVKSIIPHLSIPRMEEFLTHFVSYFNRLYSAPTGKESALWLLEQVKNHVADSNYAGEVHAQAFEHSKWIQPSIVARIEGSDPNMKDEVIILGAHLDSLNFNSALAAPGGDDNGSGSVAVLETFRALIDAGFVPKRSIEFQWYAAEEVGLRGSGEIAQAYKAQGVKVVSMMNFDVIGYHVNDEIGIITDNTDASLNDFLRMIVDEYCTYKWVNNRCGYGCSDHTSFTRAGFAAAFPVENIFSPYMHTVRDTLDTVHYPQVLEFTKLAVGYAVELSHPSQAK